MILEKNLNNNYNNTNLDTNLSIDFFPDIEEIDLEFKLNKKEISELKNTYLPKYYTKYINNISQYPSQEKNDFIFNKLNWKWNDNENIIFNDFKSFNFTAFFESYWNIDISNNNIFLNILNKILIDTNDDNLNKIWKKIYKWDKNINFKKIITSSENSAQIFFIKLFSYIQKKSKLNLYDERSHPYLSMYIMIFLKTGKIPNFKTIQWLFNNIINNQNNIINPNIQYLDNSKIIDTQINITKNNIMITNINNTIINKNKTIQDIQKINILINNFNTLTETQENELFDLLEKQNTLEELTNKKNEYLKKYNEYLTQHNMTKQEIIKYQSDLEFLLLNYFNELRIYTQLMYNDWFLDTTTKEKIIKDINIFINNINISTDQSKIFENNENIAQTFKNINIIKTELFPYNNTQYWINLSNTQKNIIKNAQINKRIYFYRNHPNNKNYYYNYLKQHPDFAKNEPWTYPAFNSKTILKSIENSYNDLLNNQIITKNWKKYLKIDDTDKEWYEIINYNWTDYVKTKSWQNQSIFIPLSMFKIKKEYLISFLYNDSHLWQPMAQRAFKTKNPWNVWNIDNWNNSFFNTREDWITASSKNLTQRLKCYLLTFPWYYPSVYELARNQSNVNKTKIINQNNTIIYNWENIILLSNSISNTTNKTYNTFINSVWFYKLKKTWYDRWKYKKYTYNTTQYWITIQPDWSYMTWKNWWNNVLQISNKIYNTNQIIQDQYYNYYWNIINWENNRKQIKDNTIKINNTMNSLSQSQQQTTNIQNNINTINKQIDDINKYINSLKKNINKNNTEIENLKTEIENLKTIIEQEEEKLNKQLELQYLQNMNIFLIEIWSLTHSDIKNNKKTFNNYTNNTKKILIKQKKELEQEIKNIKKQQKNINNTNQIQNLQIEIYEKQFNIDQINKQIDNINKKQTKIIFDENFSILKNINWKNIKITYDINEWFILNEYPNWDITIWWINFELNFLNDNTRWIWDSIWATMHFRNISKNIKQWIKGEYKWFKNMNFYSWYTSTQIKNKFNNNILPNFKNMKNNWQELPKYFFIECWFNDIYLNNWETKKNIEYMIDEIKKLWITPIVSLMYTPKSLKYKWFTDKILPQIIELQTKYQDNNVLFINFDNIVKQNISQKRFFRADWLHPTQRWAIQLNAYLQLEILEYETQNK